MMNFRVLMVSNMFWLSFASFQYTLVVFQSTTSFQACPQAVSGCFWNEALYALLHPSEQSRLLWKRRQCLVELEQSDWSPRTLAHSNSSSESGSACFLGFPMPAHLSCFTSVVPSSKGLALAFHSGVGNASHHRQCGRAYWVCTHFYLIWAWTWTSIPMLQDQRRHCQNVEWYLLLIGSSVALFGRLSPEGEAPWRVRLCRLRDGCFVCLLHGTFRHWSSSVGNGRTELADGLSSLLLMGALNGDHGSKLTVRGSSRSFWESHSHPSGYINLKLFWNIVH